MRAAQPVATRFERKYERTAAPVKERLNTDLKHAITSKVPVRTKAKFRAAATNRMSMLEQKSERVHRYFGDPKTATRLHESFVPG